MRKVIMLLILLTLLVSVDSQWSYIPSRMFASYQFKCINVNNGNASMTASNNSNPYVLPLKDIHNSLQTSQVVFGGLTNESPADSAFVIQIVGNTSTQYAFALTVQLTSSFSKMQFFLILIGSAGSGYIQAIPYTEITSLSSPAVANGNVDSSLTKYVNTTVNGTFQYKIYLSFWSLSDTLNSDMFKVGIQNMAVNGSQIEFQYYTDNGNSLTNIGLVIIVVSDNPLPVNIDSFGFQVNIYATDLNNAASNGSLGAYSTGFNRKCVLGFTGLRYTPLVYIEYDINNVISSLDQNISSPFNFHIFCMTQYYNCTKIDVNCLECISHSMCSLCDAQYYVQEYPNVTAICLRCSGAITGCDTCTNTSVCLTCITPSYLLSGSICSLCSAFIPNCLNCTTNTTCTGCVDYYGLVDPLTCTLCSTLMPGCQLCTSAAVCSLCYNGYYLSGSTCYKCNLGVPNCAVCASATICLLCYSDSYLSSDNRTCICNAGLTLVTGLCAVYGCSSAYRFNTSTVCLSCNTSLNFYYQNSSCYCSTGFIQATSECNLICGDGLVVTEPCDDGNVVSGDGCSSVCTVETDYSCVNGSLTSRSICVYVGYLSLKLVDILKVVGANQAHILLDLSPSTIRSLTRMDFNKYLVLSVSSSRLLYESGLSQGRALANAAITYSTTYSDDGSMTVQVNYDSHLEGLPAQLTLSYDPSMIGLAPTTLQFNMVGHNQPLNASPLAGISKITLYLGYGLAGVFILQMLLSMVFHKMIGLETMQILQIVYFVRYLLDNSGDISFYDMESIGYINGYNVFDYYTNFMYLDSVLWRLGLGKTFVFNVMIQAGLIVIAWVFSYCFGRKVTGLKQRGAQSTSLGMEEVKKAQALTYKATMCAFILSVYSFFLFSFALLSSIQKPSQVYNQLPRLLIIFTMFVFFYLAFYLSSQIYTNWRQKYDEDEGLIFKYVSLFLIYHLMMVFLIIGLHGSSFGLELIAAVQLLYVIVLIIVRPYYLTVQNVLLIICEVLGFGFSAFLVAVKYVSLVEEVVGYVVVTFEGLLCLVAVLALIRMYLHSKFNQKAFKLMHEEQDRLKGKDTFTKMQFKKQQEMLLANQNSKPVASKQRILREKEQKDELTRIKGRLKQEHKKKLQMKDDNAFVE